MNNFIKIFNNTRIYQMNRIFNLEMIVQYKNRKRNRELLIKQKEVLFFSFKFILANIVKLIEDE